MKTALLVLLLLLTCALLATDVAMRRRVQPLNVKVVYLTPMYDSFLLESSADGTCTLRQPFLDHLCPGGDPWEPRQHPAACGTIFVPPSFMPRAKKGGE